MRVLAQTLAGRGALKPGLTPSEAADALWLFNDPGVYHRLVIERHWNPDRHQNWLADALISLLIPASYQPETSPPPERRLKRRLAFMLPQVSHELREHDQKAAVALAVG